MATIFCFTSTGNSLYTAKRIAEKIGGDVMPMTKDSVICEEDVIGFVFPVYFWGLPRMAERFVAGLQITNKNAYVFAVATCGGPGFGVLGWLRKPLKAKGVRLHYGVNLLSVTNYLPDNQPNDSEALRQEVDQKIAEIIDAVQNRKRKRVFPYTVINKAAYKLMPDARSDQFFAVASSCTGCMTCRDVCPAKNIHAESGKPSFAHRCEHCLACVHHCPARAIDWKQKTQGKERYRNAHVSLDELISFHRADGAITAEDL